MSFSFAATSPEFWFTACAAALSMAGVALPFARALMVVVGAHALTARGKGGLRSPVAGVVDDVVAEASRNPSTPLPFLRDAAKQYVLHEYAANYERPLSMYANLLPPVGFIGTTLGLVVLFGSMQFSHAALEVGALGLALSSTLFALTGYATLESLRIALYGRLIRQIDDALTAHSAHRPGLAAEDSGQPA